MLERIKELIMWKKARVFSIDMDMGEVVLRSRKDFHKIYFMPYEEEAGLSVGDEILFRFVTVDGKRKILTRVRSSAL